MSINQQREEQEIFTSNKTRKKTMENLNELLLEKCKEGNLSEVLALLDRGADIHARNKYQYTPLHMACAKGKIEVIMALLDRGADIYARNIDQKKPCDYIQNSNMKLLYDQFVGGDKVLRDLLMNRVPKVHSDETVSWNQARVGVIGKSGAGKSCTVQSLLGESNKDAKHRPQSTNAVDKFECRNVNVSTGNGANLKKIKKSQNQTEWRVAEICRLKKETRPKEKVAEQQVEAETKGSGQLHQEILSEFDAKQSLASEDSTNTNSMVISTITPDLDVKSTEIDVEAKPNPVELPLDQSKIMQLMGQASTSSGLVLTICDYGGQRYYDALHYLFFTKNTLYMIVFDMSRVLHDENHVDDELMLLKCWIERVVLYTEENGQMSPILLVGTHYDKLKDNDEDIATLESEVNEKLKSLIESIKVKTKIDIDKAIIKPPSSACNVIYFAVDNINSENRKAFNDIIRSMEHSLENAPHVQRKVPLAWIKCCDDFLRKAMDDKIVSLTLEEAGEVMEIYGVAREDVLTALAFFHEMGVLFWLDRDDLREIVVLDPFEAFVKPIRTIICDPKCHMEGNPHKECREEMQSLYNKYKDHGQIAFELLAALLKEWEANQAVIIKLMCDFELMVPLPGDIYLVPSLLQEKDDLPRHDYKLIFLVCNRKEKLLDQVRGERCIKKSHALDVGFIQSGFFNRVLVAAVKEISNSNEVGNYAFSKHAAMLSYGSITYIIRAHKTHISLEVGKILNGNCRETVDLASHVQGAIQGVMEGLKMYASFDLHLLLENDDIYMGLENVRYTNKVTYTNPHVQIC